MWSIHVGSNVQILEKELSEREQEVGGREKEDKGSFNVSFLLSSLWGSQDQRKLRLFWRQIPTWMRTDIEQNSQDSIFY